MSRVVYLLGDENKWNQVLGQINHVLSHPEQVDKVAVIVVGTAILSCLKAATLISFQDQVTEKASKGVDFFLCVNTMHKYGITPDMIMPVFSIATQGGVIKAIELKEEGYHLFTIE